MQHSFLISETAQPSTAGPSCAALPRGCLFGSQAVHHCDNTPLHNTGTTRRPSPAPPPQGLSQLIADCLQQDPSRRPTAQQALERLQAL